MNVYVCLEFTTTVLSHSPEYIEYHPIFKPFSQSFSFWGWSKSKSSIFKLFDVFPCMSTPEPPLKHGMCFNGYLYRDGVQFQGTNLFFFGIVWVAIRCQMITVKWYVLHVFLGPKIALCWVPKSSNMWPVQPRFERFINSMASKNSYLHISNFRDGHL